jgi:hypothetical protein
MNRRPYSFADAQRGVKGTPVRSDEDQTYFALDAKSFAAFQDMLDKPPAPTDRLRRTLKARAPWDTAPEGQATSSRDK